MPVLTRRHHFYDEVYGLWICRHHFYDEVYVHVDMAIFPSGLPAGAIVVLSNLGPKHSGDAHVPARAELRPPRTARAHSSFKGFRLG